MNPGGAGSNTSSRVVMVRKTEQRTFKTGETPQFQTVTRETVETFRGNRSERITTSEKRDVYEEFPKELNDALKSARNDSSTEVVVSPGVTPATLTSRPTQTSKVTPTSRPTPTPTSRPTLTPTSRPTLTPTSRPTLTPTSRPTLTPTSRPTLTSTNTSTSKSFQKIDTKLPGLFKSKSTDSAIDGDFASECLKAHNEYRQKHGVPSLKLNKKLCKFSEEWAKRLATRGVLEHRQGTEYGENIFCVWNSNPEYTVTGREPVDNWYGEIKDHVFGREPTDLRTGHFTQVVWQDSKELGVAFAKSAKTGQIFVVANYSPPGNYVGNYTDNVFPIGGATELKPSIKSVGTAAKTAVKTAGTSTKSDSSSAGFDEEIFEREGLRVHNEYRRKHGVSDLTINREICSYAKDWATLLIRDNKFCHRQDGKYGENLYTSWSSDPSHKVSAADACNSWYAEIKDHTFGVEPRSMKSGHFTQMIWKGSTELGIGAAKANGRVIIVANYNPRGNYIGQFAANCPKPR